MGNQLNLHPRSFARTLAQAAESLALTFFVIYIHSCALTPGWSWLLPYLLASIIGITVSLYLVSQKIVLNRLFLGINLYFASGLLGVALQWQPLNQLYAQAGAAAMLAWILVVGVGITLKAPIGALGVTEPPRRLYSWYLLAACAVAFFWAVYFKSSTILGEWMPFIFIFAARGYLSAKAAQQLRNTLSSAE